VSAIVGLFNLDGKPATPQTLESAMVAIEHYGGDGTGLWTKDSVGFGHLMRHITPESIDESLPYEDGHFAITADARIDNRNELFEALSVPPSLRTSIPDSVLILRAFQYWGEASPKHLIGEFAFCIWDGRTRELFCACDHIGIRPFYYFYSKSLFAFATDIRALWRLPGVPVDFDDGAVARYLVEEGGNECQERTFYRGISKLLLGRSLSISQKGLRTGSYWLPFEGGEIRFRAETDYAEQLRELMDKAVVCRLRTNFPVAAHISGGLDSSSVAVLAARQLRAKGRQLTMGYSWSPPRSDEYPPRHDDERDRIEFIARREAFPVHFVSATPRDWLERFDRFPMLGDLGNYGLERLVAHHAAGLNIRTILTGYGGDQGITMRGKGYLAELLRGGKWLKLLREWTKSHKSFKSCLLETGLPFLRWFDLALEKRTAGRAVPLIHPGFKRKMAQELESKKILFIQVGLHENQRFLVHNGDLSLCPAEWTNWTAGSGISHTYPMLDRRILEFAYRLPSELFLRNGIRAYVFRLAMHDVLPSETLWLSSKSDPVHMIQKERQWRAAWQILAQEFRAGQWQTDSPYIDFAGLRQSILNVPRELAVSSDFYRAYYIHCALDVIRLWDRIVKPTRIEMAPRTAGALEHVEG